MNATRTHEEWRPVPNYEGLYEVSDRGQVRSVDRLVDTMTRWGEVTQRRVPGKVRKLVTHPNGGHLYLQLHKGGGRKPVFVHNLVLAAFVGPRPVDKPETRHLDGNPTNNHISNLRYGTHAENCADTIAHGTHSQGSKTHCVRGHEYTDQNTYIRPDGKGRGCMSCMKAHTLRHGARYQRDYRARKRAAQLAQAA